jgi:hypothetical protein
MLDLKLKLLEENIGKTLQGIGIGKDFLNRTPVDQELRVSIDKYDCINLKSFYTAKETINRVNRSSPKWEKNLCQIFI